MSPEEPTRIISDEERHFRYVAENIPCQDGCPAHTDIPTYIREGFEARYGDSYETNRFVNIFPGVLGRICSRPCEERCRHGEAGLGEPVGICHLKRAAAERKPPDHAIQEKLFPASGKKVAVVGAGPAGLACAHDLAVYGHKVTIYEAREEAGGMLRYGIPAFRLPRTVIDAEAQNILRLGVELRTGVSLGADVRTSELLERHDAVVVAAGCYRPGRLKADGEELPGVYSGLAFMDAANSGREMEPFDHAVVIGGGFTAMDCARMAVRYGAKKVTVAVLTTEEEMFAAAEEIKEAKYEGIEIQPLSMTRAFLPGDDGKLAKMRFVRTRLGEMQPDGLMHEALPIDGSEFEIDVDAAIVAIGQGPEDGLSDLPFDRSALRGSATGTEGLFLTGDHATGASTVIGAVASGRRTAGEVDLYLTGARKRVWAVRFEDAGPSDRERTFDYIPRLEMPTLALADRLGDPAAEVEQGLGGEAAIEEAKRCYLCHLRFTIDVSRCIYCRYCIDVAPRDCIKLAKELMRDETGHVTGIVETKDWSEVMAVAIDNEQCIRCGNCYRVCPTRCIGVTRVSLAEVDASHVPATAGEATP